MVMNRAGWVGIQSDPRVLLQLLILFVPSHQDDQWMQLYLAGCKLLEALCTLPAGYLAQFQM